MPCTTTRDPLSLSEAYPDSPLKAFKSVQKRRDPMPRARSPALRRRCLALENSAANRCRLAI